MFEIGTYVVYGNTGICRIEDITTLDMPWANSERQYYIMSPIRAQGSRDYLPVDNNKVVLRKVISKEEALELIDRIPEIELLEVDNDKLREEKYRELAKQSDCASWITIIKTIYLRKQERIAQGKKITATDDRYYKMAVEHLYSELGFALDKEPSEIEEFITNRIELYKGQNV